MRYDRERNRSGGREGRDNRNNPDPRQRRDDANRSRRNRGMRFRRRQREFPRRLREERPEAPPCPICERPVMELSHAINHLETNRPAHFDCVLKKIEETEGELAPNEKICYLGKGSFGVLRFQKTGGGIPFIIRKRIQYENVDEKPDWRKKLDRYTPRGKSEAP